MPQDDGLISPPLTGSNLQKAVTTIKEQRPVLAEGLLYQDTILMLSADPGVGKSTLSTQASIELSAGQPVFGVFEVPKPLKVLYIQTERALTEYLERLQILKDLIPTNYDNLMVTDEYQRLNLLNPKHSEIFIKSIVLNCKGVDVIIIDPIYPLVAGGLKDDLPASIFTKVMSTLQSETRATLWYNHHNTKAQYARDGAKIEKEDPFYGSTWLKAHCTGSFMITKDEKGTKWTKKKDNYSVLVDHFNLEYDQETGLSRTVMDDLPVVERFRMFLEQMKKQDKTFTFDDIVKVCKVSPRCARRHMVHSSFANAIFCVSTNKRKKIYKFGG